MTTKSQSHVAPDPIFAVIKECREIDKRWRQLSMKLDEAEIEARRTLGLPRPRSLIAWRDYSAIGGHEIERARAEFLRCRVADPEQIEKEYQDAKARELAAELEGQAWDLRAGVAELRKQKELAIDAAYKAEMRLARMKPTTPEGAAALLDLVRRDLRDEFMSGGDWREVALRSVAEAFRHISAV